ncbi:MAG: aldehyde dehydrogenase family protein [Ilumatobacteraceae bacterium]
MAYTDGKMLIDGDLVEAASGKRFERINPATEELAGTAPDGAVDDLDRAVSAARRVADRGDWAADREFRKHCLTQLQEVCKGYADQWRHELVAEVGTPVMWTHMFQLDWPIEHALGAPLRLMDTYDWEINRGVLDGAAGRYRRTVVKNPVGVVGAIVPWNFPMEITLSKLGPIIATGNTVVFKAAPDTPISALRLGELIAKTDIPAGVVNIVTSSDHLVGEALAGSPQVDMVAFTGSTATGKRVMEVAARNVTRVFLELGGKSATIVLDDADFAAALPGSVQTCIHAGQGCALPTRLLVPRSRYGEAVEILEAAWSHVPYGDPTDPSIMAGPLISARQRERVLGYIAAGRAEGARAAVGGGIPAHLPTGWYVEPTLFVDVENKMQIAQEEIFGPVLVVIPFDDDDDAVRIANDSIYGLSGGVIGGDIERATRVARRIRTGSMSVNGAGGYLCDMPFGGYKQSGIGRQWGHEGFDELMEYTSLSTPAS